MTCPTVADPESGMTMGPILSGPQPLSTNFFSNLVDKIINVQAATWEGQFPGILIKIRNSNGVYWCGGTIKGTFPPTTSWEEMHNRYAISLDNAYDTYLNALRINNTGDAVSIKGVSDGWMLYGSHISMARDDAVQNDFGCRGQFTDCLIDGCHVGYSSRPYAADVPDNSNKRVYIENNLIRLKTMPTGYNGKLNGRFFKMDNEAQAGWPGHHRDPKLGIFGNILRLDAPSDYRTTGDFIIPPQDRVPTCYDNVIVWGGQGPFPYQHLLYPGWTVTTDLSVWDNARADWLLRHPGVAQEYPFPS